MPITITLPQPFGVVGPGCNIGLQSSFIGPLPSGSHWDIQILTGPTFEDLYVRETRFTQSNPFNLYLLSSGGASIATQNGTQPAPSTDVRVVAELLDGGTVLDQGSITTHWDPTVGLGLQTALRGGASGGGGFTAEDRAQLQAIETRTQTIGEPEELVVQTPSGLQTRTIGQMLSRPLLDLLTLHEATSGPTGDPVRFQIKDYYFGVIVRVTTIAEDLVAKTPDMEWYFPDLAVLRVFRGADLQFRRGIHTPTFMTEHPWEWGLPILNQADILGIPPDITIAVDWRAGCAGQVFLQLYP